MPLPSTPYSGYTAGPAPIYGNRLSGNQTMPFWAALAPLIGQAVGQGMQSYGQGKMSDADRALQQRQLDLQQRQTDQQRQLALMEALLGAGQFDAAQQLQRQMQGSQLAQADPLQAQAARQRQALMADILPGLRNVSVSSNIPGMSSFIPQVSGGLRIPEGGFSQEAMRFYSPESRAQAEGEFYKQTAPFLEPPDLSQVGYGSAGQGPTGMAQSARRQALEDALNQSQARRRDVTESLGTLPPVGTTYPGEPQKPGKKMKRFLWSTIGMPLPSDIAGMFRRTPGAPAPTGPLSIPPPPR